MNRIAFAVAGVSAEKSREYIDLVEPSGDRAKRTFRISQPSAGKTIMKPVLVVASLLVVLGQAFGQESPQLKSFLAETAKLRQSLEAEIGKTEAECIAKFELLKQKTVDEIDAARKVKMAADDLDAAIALRTIAKEVESTTWLSAKTAKAKKMIFEFSGGNRLIKRADGQWEEEKEKSYVWQEKQRADGCLTLHDPKRDCWARVYDDGSFFFQDPELRKAAHWALLEGKWVGGLSRSK